MARWVATLNAGSATSGGLVALGGLMMGVCAMIMVLGLCTLTGRGKRIRNKEPSDCDDSPSRHSGKEPKNLSPGQKDQHVIEQPEQVQQPEQGQERSPVWQRTILMGERCKPPAFSGLILYDESGNRLKDRPMKSRQDVSNPVAL